MLKFLSLILISLLPISAFAIEISSPAFKDGETIPKKYGCKYNIKAYSLNTKLEKSLKGLTQEKFEKLYENEIISSFMISGKFK